MIAVKDIHHAAGYILCQELCRCQAPSCVRIDGIHIPVNDIWNIGRKVPRALGLQFHFLGGQIVEHRNKGLVCKLDQVVIRAPGPLQRAVGETRRRILTLFFNVVGDGGHQLGVTAAEVIDSLLRVTYPVTALSNQLRQNVEDFDLRRIGVLEFVHKDVVDGFVDILPNLGF